MAAPAEEEAGGGVNQLCLTSTGHGESRTPLICPPPPCMADMAPALTGAVQEAPHRLKLTASASWKARSGLLLLNGGEYGRELMERLEGAPREGEAQGRHDRETLNIVPRERESQDRLQHGQERLEGAQEEGQKRSLHPWELRLEGASQGRVATAAGPKKNVRIGPAGGLLKSRTAEPVPATSTAPGPVTLSTLGPTKLSIQGSSDRLEGVPGPVTSSAPVVCSIFRGLTSGHSECPGSAPWPTKSSALGSSPVCGLASGRSVSSNSTMGPLAVEDSHQRSLEGHKHWSNARHRQGDVSENFSSGPMAGLESVQELLTHQDVALVGSQELAPVCVPQISGADFHPPQDSSPGPSTSQDPVPGPRVLCTLRAAQMSNRQQQLGARARRLCRRLQVIQAKQVERHVRQQLSGLVEMLSERGAAALPGSPHIELDRLASSSSTRLRAAQGGFDSDATESSSGGESDGEESAGSVEEEQNTDPAADRGADWRWAVERAAIICHWTWLQAQVSDLEFRIRQQTEIYKQIRCSKGSVTFGDSANCEDSVQQPVGSSVVLKGRGSRLPSLLTPKAPVADDLCDSLLNTPPQSLDKQGSRLPSEGVCQNPRSTPVSASPASQKTARQVNGLLNCLRTTVPCNGSTEDLDPEEVLGKKRRVESLSTPASLSDSTCVAARTRPLRGYRRRSLVRCSDLSSLSRKPQKPLTAKCSCLPPTMCILCGCQAYTKSPHLSSLPRNQRIALMDPSSHPILSFPYETPLHLHFEALLKEDRRFRLCNKMKILKLAQLSRRAQDTGNFSHVRCDQERLLQYRVDNWQRNRLISDSTADRTRSPFQRPTPNLSFSGSFFQDDRQYKGISSPVIPRPIPAAHQLSSLTETVGSSSFIQQNTSSLAIKRKKFETSYDIDNIIIPMSLVAASRVEKLQYKEILTPSWRLLDSVERDLVLDANPQLEDLSDETYQDRHNGYEDVERSRWDCWTSSTPQRRGSRSSNKSDGRWTPQPSSSSIQGSQQVASPDIRCHSLNDIPLFLSSAASDSPEPHSSVHSRTRVLSWSEDTRSSTPEMPEEEEQTIQPWELRSFPLSDTDCRALQDQPETPNSSKAKPHLDISWPMLSKPDTQTDTIDSDLTPTSKESHLLNSISVVRVRSNSGEKIASLEYFPARPVNKR